MKTNVLVFAWLVTSCCIDVCAAEKPLKVYILVGQSNMQGHAQVRTFEHIGMDPKTAPILDELLNADGSPRSCEQVWISSIGHDGGETERHGQLIAGYGAAGREPKIGPEYTFGIYMQKFVKEPILIIKTAWGGKSLNTDFRPPSAGPYEFDEQQLQNLKKQGKDIEKVKAERAKATGRYYGLMVNHVRNVLSNIKRVYPDYDPKAGYELSGFVWFQGWNDMVDRGTYPDRSSPGGYDQYSKVLAHFIRDVRKDLSAPDMPFVIGVMGVGGPVENYGPDQQRYKSVHDEFRKAMAAPAAMPEFMGNVTAVLTEKYWDAQLSELSARWGKINSKRRSLNQDKTLEDGERKEALHAFTSDLFTPEELKALQVGKSNAEYHYLGSAKIMAQIGKAFAEALAEETTPVTLPRIEVTPITEPPCSYCSTQHLKSLIGPNDRVIAWLRAAHNGGAFPIRHFLSAPRVVNDTYGLFYYDPDGGYVAAFEKDYGYKLHGWRRGVMVVQGKDGTLWSALTGKAFSGPQKGEQLERIPSMVTNWNYWLMLHPESTTYDLFDGKKYETKPLPTEMSQLAKASMNKVDGRLDAMTNVLGVEFASEQKAFPLDRLPERACLLDEVDEQAVAVFWYRRTKTAVAFDRRIDGRKLTFYADDISPESAPFKDKETRTRWSLAGRGIDGPLRGTELKWIKSIQCRWYAWSSEYPETKVHDSSK